MRTAYDIAKARQKLPPPGERRRIREDAGVTQEALATECGVSQPTLARWERDAITPRGQHVIKYVRVLRRLADIMDGRR
jgi:predicted transcriptional regulator